MTRPATHPAARSDSGDIVTTFALSGREFLRDGRPHRILSGALHYFRLLPEQWERQLRMLRAMGLNTVETYVPWNLHERTEGEFTGLDGLDLFLQLAAAEGLDAIVRPGPYICAEWENGGLPAWLTARAPGRIRSSDAEWLRAVDAWFDAVVPVIAAHLVTRGGNVVMVQVENEYGSYGSDRRYLEHLRDGLRTRGIDVPLFTSDGPEPWMLAGGMVDGVLATVNFGSRAREAFAVLESVRPGEPLMCMEFWNGWFDHWGGPHADRDAVDAAAALAEILECGASVNLYMAQGGTNFGPWAGANRGGDTHEGEVLATTTSYDYDAPIDERGEPTRKFHLFQDVLRAHATLPAVEVPAPRPRLAVGDVVLTPGDPYFATDAVSAPVDTSAVPSLDELGVDQGVAWHRATIAGPRPPMPLTCTEVGDHLAVYADGALLARARGRRVVIDLPAIPAEGLRIDLVVDSLGRTNYGPLLGERKGIAGQVRHGIQLVHGFTSSAGRLDALPTTVAGLGADAAGDAAIGPRFHHGTFTVSERGDTWLTLSGTDRAVAWVGGLCLGRLLAGGPQGALLVPAEALAIGANGLTVLDLAPTGPLAVTLIDAPLWRVD